MLVVLRDEGLPSATTLGPHSALEMAQDVVRHVRRYDLVAVAGAVTALHRLSVRAGLPPNRRLHPHGLRHLAATQWLRYGAGLDHVRRLLGHTSLSTTLRYSSLVSADLRQAHRDAGAIERMGLDRFQGARRQPK